jgi:RNA polymerase-binding transcription factor DksA
MNISRIFTLCIACTLLSTSLCHAWWPLPTSRDAAVFTTASIGTFAFVRSYYLGQEKRIKEAIRAENEATRSAIVNQGQETRNVVETAGKTVVAAVESTHTDVRRVGNQATMLLNQNETLAEMLLAIHKDQQRILASQLRIEEGTLGKLSDTSHNLLEDAQPSSSQQQSQRYPVSITALATKLSFPNPDTFKNLQLQKTVSVPHQEQTFPTFKTFRAYGSTQDTSFGARLGNGFSAIKTIFWKNNQD